MWRSLIGCIGFAVCCSLFACKAPETRLEPYTPPPSKDYTRPLPPGALALRKVPLAEYPDFSPAARHYAGLEDAIRHSLAYFDRPSSMKYYPYGQITHARARRSLEAFLQILETRPTGQDLNTILRRDFELYESVGYDNQGTVYFTGYYCPIFDGRRTPDAEFRYPLYGLPPDLVKDEEGQTLGQRNPDGSVDPRYPTRREIEEGRLLDGYEVAYVRNPFEAYVITVQGSAKLRMPDGSLLELGYVGNNGHPYTPIAAAMVANGVIGRSEVSLQNLLRYFRENPDQVYHYAWKNDRYVFFKELPGGPYGSLNVPVTPYRSIATDKSVFPRGCLTFLSTEIPTIYDEEVVRLPFSAFALDQDTGGAIRAAGRCDIYMGIGPEAEAVAGRTGAEGRLYYAFIREDQSKSGSDFDN